MSTNQGLLNQLINKEIERKRAASEKPAGSNGGSVLEGLLEKHSPSGTKSQTGIQQKPNASIEKSIRSYGGMGLASKVDWNSNPSAWRQKYSGKNYSDIQSALNDQNTKQAERDWLQRYMETDRDFLSTLSSKQLGEIMAGVSGRIGKTSGMLSVPVNGFDSSSMEHGFEAMRSSNQEKEDLAERLKALEWAKRVAERREKIGAEYGGYYDSPLFEATAQTGASRKNPTMQEVWEYNQRRMNGEATNGQTVTVQNPLEYYLSNWEKAGDATDDTTILRGKAGHWEMLAGEDFQKERQMYNYLLQARGVDAANQYLNDIGLLIDKAASEAQTKRTKAQYDSATGLGKAALNVASIPANVFGGAVNAAGQAISAVRGEFNPYIGGELAQFGREVRENTAAEIVDSIGEEHPIWGQIAANTYQGIMSGADSAMGAVLMGNGYTAMMGSGAASQRALELYESGASGVQIGLGAVASGLIEVATEKYSIEKFTERFLKGNISGFTDWAKKTLLQGLNEGSEEIASELLNMVVDALAMGANSGNQQEIREMMLSGMSRGEAEKQAFLNRALDVFWAGYGGLVSGGAMGGIGGAINDSRNSKAYMEAGRAVLKAGTREALAEQAGDSRLSRRVAKDAAKGKDGLLATRRAGRLYTQSINQQVEKIQNAERKVVRSAVEAELDSRGIQDKSGVIANMLEKTAYGETLSGTEGRLYQSMNGGEILQAVAQNENIQQSVEKATAESRKQLRQTAELTVDTKELAKMVDADSLNVSTEGKTLVTGTDGSTTETAVKGVKAVGGKLMIALEDGSTAKNSQISYADSGEAALYTVVSGMNIPEASANALIQAAPADRAAKERYAFGVQEMYRYGALGIPMGAVSNPVFASSLTAAQRQAAYNLGKNAYQKANAAAVEGVKQKTTAKRGEGRVTFNGNEKSLSDLQRGSLKALRLVAKALKVNIEVFQSETRDGKHIGENGSYDPDTGTIRIDISAGADGKGTMLFTLAHELTHFMKEWSPAKYQTFSEFLLENYAENGVPVDLLVQRQMEKAKRNGRTISRETALEEVVADSCEQMLSDGKAIERLEALRQTDRAVFEKVVDFIHDIAEKVKELYKGLQPDSLEARYVAQMQDAFERLQELWTEGVADAAGNFENAEVEEESFSRTQRFSSRDEAQFKENIDYWVKSGKPDTVDFIIGSTSNTLQGLGAMESDIYIRGEKLNKILVEHPEMTLDDIKKIPSILNDPVLILKSKNVGRRKTANTRMVLFGSEKALNKLPILVVFDLRPVENHFVVEDMQKVTSAYTKTQNPTDFVRSSQVMYADKKRTTSLLRSIGFQMPIELHQSGFIGSITYKGRSVNLDGADFADVFAEQNIRFSMRENVADTEAFKKWFGQSKAVDENGKPKVLYHQTSADFTIFDTRHEGAGSRDQDTPFGIFMKGTDANIGLRGEKQMALYASIQNPMTVRNREDLMYQLKKLSPEYVSLSEEHRRLDDEYHEKYENAGKAVQQYMTEWRKAHPDASRRALWDDAEFVRLYDAEDEVLDEWESEARKIETQSKEVITKALENAGYDGVFIGQDKGSWGRSTDAIIALRPEQVKSATDNVGTFDGANPDIRYSDREQKPYTYAFFASKPDMVVVNVDSNSKYTRESATAFGKQNALEEGFANEYGGITVTVNDTGKEVIIGRNGLRHGLRRANSGNYNENLIVTAKAGSIIKNSIQMNELNPKYDNVDSSYPLLGIAKNQNGDYFIVETIVDTYTNEAVSMDVLYSMNAKKEPGALNVPQATAKLLPFTGSSVKVTDFLKLVNKYFPDILPEDVLKHFGHDARPEGELGKYALYSDRDNAAKENAKLRADVANLKELLKLQGTTTGGTVFQKKSLTSAANFILKESGRTMDADSREELTGMLAEAYAVLGNQDVTYDDILAQCSRIAQWVDENGEVKEVLDGYAESVLDEMKGIPITLDDVQKEEVKHLFGSVGAFRSRIAGTYKLAKDGVPLDTVWNGLTIDHPMYFDDSASSADLPRLLVEAIDRLRNSTDYEASQPMSVEDISVAVYDGFWKAKKLTTVADRYQAKLDAVMKKHDAAMKAAKADRAAAVADIRKQWDEEAAAMEKNFQYELTEQEKSLTAEHTEEMRRAEQAHRKEVDELHRQWDEKAEAIRASMQYDAKEEMKRVLHEHAEGRKAAVENRKRTEYRQQIRKMADKFHKMATEPGKSDSAHAPVRLMRAVAKFCDIFAESEQHALKMAEYNLTGRELKMAFDNDRLGVSKGRQMEAEAIQRVRERNGRKAEAIAAMQKAYAEIQGDGAMGIFHDEFVQGLLDKLSKELSGTDIYEMNTDQLKQVYNTMQAMMHTIVNANKLFSMGKDKELISTAKKLGSEIDQVKVNYNELLVKLRRYWQWQMAPDTFFSYICGFIKDNEGKAVQKAFSDGTERMLGVQRDFYQMFRHLTEAEDKATSRFVKQMMADPMKTMVAWGLKDAQGNEVKTTRGMMLQAYMLLNQQDSFDSLIYGGFKLPRAEDYYKGRIDAAYGDAEEGRLLSGAVGEEISTLTKEIKDLYSMLEEGVGMQEAEDIERRISEKRKQGEQLIMGAEAQLINLRNAIAEKLTVTDRDLLATAAKWYKHTGQLMTEVYTQMYGYKPNLVEGYVPIHRDLTTVKVDIRTPADAFNLENSGFTKERVYSTAPILLTDFFEELNRQQNQISRYYGFAQVQKDFNRVWNLKMPGARTSINAKVAAKYGTGKTLFGVSGESYVSNYIQAVSGANSSEDILSSFYGNAASATLSLNPRVALSQLASIPTASAVVGWKNMAVGFAKGVGTSLSRDGRTKLMNDSVWFYQRYRGAGGSTEFSDLQMKGTLWGKAAASPVGKALFGWCQYMDVFATASMWAMAEEQVSSTTKLAKGSESYREAVQQCYADIIRKSQPNYTVTERSDMLRDKRGGMKLLNMYKTQSNQNLNILVSAAGEYSRMTADLKAKKNGVTQSDVEAARKKLANGITSVTLGGTLTFVLLRVLANFVWGKVNPYRDEETDEVTMQATMAAAAKEAGSSVAGMFTLGGQLYDFVYSAVSGERYYGISDSAISSITSTIENLNTVLANAVNPDKDVTWKQIEKAVKSTLELCGVPAGNAQTFIKDAQMWYRDLTGGTFRQFTSGETSKAQYQARLLQAYRQGDSEKCGSIVALMAAGSDALSDSRAKKEMVSAMKTYLKKQYTEGTVTEQEATGILKQYFGMTDSELKPLMMQWKGIAETGRTLEQTKDAYFEKKVSSTEYVNYLVKYSGKSREDAQSAEKKLRCERDEGVIYSDIDKLIQDGKLSHEKAVRLMTEYGGESAENAEKHVTKQEWKREIPGLNPYIGEDTIAKYTEYCERSGVPKTVFYDLWEWKKEHSKKVELVSYIAGLRISDAQRSALWKAFRGSNWKAVSGYGWTN